jgi:hypothetical protein
MPNPWNEEEEEEDKISSKQCTSTIKCAKIKKIIY